MAKITTEILPPTFSGILMPNIAHRFMLEFRFNNSKETSDYLSRQVVNCKMNYLNKIVTVDIEQPASIPDFHDVLFEDIAHSTITGTLVVQTTHYNLSLIGCRCIDHQLDFDYSDSAAVTHRLKFEFNGVHTSKADNPF